MNEKEKSLRDIQENLEKIKNPYDRRRIRFLISLIADKNKEIKRLNAAVQKKKAGNDLIFAYETVLRELRTHSVANPVLDEWVRRLDRSRDQYMLETGIDPAKVVGS